MTIPEKILFVDDEQDILSSFKRQFRKKADIHTAISGQEALDLMDKEDEFAVIISDMRMPNMDGAEFLEKAKNKSPNTVRILLTGQTDLNSAISAVNQGQIYRFLSKPCPQEDLQNTLKNAVRQYRLINTEKTYYRIQSKDLLSYLVNYSLSLNLIFLITLIVLKNISAIWQSHLVN